MTIIPTTWARHFKHWSKASQAVVLWLVFPAFLLAKPAEFHQGLLTLPVVEDGGDTYTFELKLQENAFPPEFKLVYSERTFAPVTVDTPYFLGDLLVIPEIVLDGESYWVELALIDNELFRLDSYGVAGNFEPAGYFGTFAGDWERIHGNARDIGVGADGTVWVLGGSVYYDFDFDFDPEDIDYDFGLYVLDRFGWLEIPGSGIRLDVDPQGNPWVINHEHEIFHLTPLGWERIPGRANDIGIGADGTVWVLGTTERQGGYEIFYLTPSGWRKIHGTGVRIDVDPAGNPWVVNHDDEIFRLVNGYWQKLPGLAKDIGIGADGSVWVIGSNERAGGYGIYYWTGYEWRKVHGSASQISVGPDGRPWVVNRDGEIYRRL